jgi:MFS family permease
MNNKTKLNKFYGFIIKTAIIVVAFWFIYRRLFVKDNLDETLRTFEDNFREPHFIKIMLIVGLLMIVNWGIETFKWKFLIRKIENVNFFKAIVAVLSGITVSIFTPNRIGEYAGRVFILDRADRWEGVLITMLGSMSQLLITIIAGSIGFVFFTYEYIDLSIDSEYLIYGLVPLILIVIIALISLFYNVSFLTRLMNKLPGKLKKLRRYGKIFSDYSKWDLSVVMLLSLARYLVFITQFFLLLNLFESAIPYGEAIVMISMIYLVMAAIPTIALTELGIRGSVALYFIGLYFESHNPAGQNDLGIFTASSVLWLINLAIPALLGAIFVFKLKFFRKD